MNDKMTISTSRLMIYADISFLHMQLTAHWVKGGLFGTSFDITIRSRQFQ